MSEKPLPIVNTEELADKVMKLIADKQAPAQKPSSLNEQKPQFNYREKLVEMIRDTNMGWKWTGENKDMEMKFFEAIGAASAGSAVPEIWAKDVFRCCPYPASAFWDAPFIRWHDDIQGKPGDTIHVITVGRATCGTAGCAEPVSTAPTISAVAITLEEYQCSLYICRNDLEDVVADTLTEIDAALITCLDNCIDNAFIANIIGKGSTLDKGTAYVTPGMIAEAIGTMRSNQLKRNIYLRTRIHEPMGLEVCGRKVSRDLQLVHVTVTPKLVHHLKGKHNAKNVGKNTHSTIQLMHSGFAHGARKTLIELPYMRLLDLNVSKICMPNSEQTGEINAICAESPTMMPVWNCMNETERNIQQTPFITFLTGGATSYYCVMFATKQQNGHSKNSTLPTLISNREFRD